jgi:hypothetical protein
MVEVMQIVRTPSSLAKACPADIFGVEDLFEKYISELARVTT